MTNTSNTPDPRIEAAAAAMWEQRPMMRTADGAPRPWAEVPAWSYGARYREQARVALAAADAVDPRTPRTIETAEAVDALPVGSVVLDADGDPARKFAGGWRTMVVEPDGSAWLSGCMEDPGFPVTVIHEPETTRRTTTEATNIDYAMATAAAAGVPLTEAQVREYIAPGTGPEAEVTQ